MKHKLVNFFQSMESLQKITFLESLPGCHTVNLVREILFTALTDRDILVKITASDLLTDIEIPLNKSEQNCLNNLFLKSRSPILRRNIIIAMAKNHCEISIYKLEQKIHSNTDSHVIAGIYLALVLLGKYEYVTKFIDLIDSPNYQVACFVANSIPQWINSPLPLIKNRLMEKLENKNPVSVQEALSNAIARIETEV